MRLLFVPARDAYYDFRLVRDLARAVEDQGHVCDVVMVEDRANQERLKQVDVLFEVNRPRPEFLPSRVRHVAWVQDLTPKQRTAYCVHRNDDLIYTLGDADMLGAANLPNWRGSLLTGVDPGLLELPPLEPTVDFSICGYIPIPYRWDGPEYGFHRDCLVEIQRFYKPLSGSFRIKESIANLRERFASFEEFKRTLMAPADFDKEWGPVIEFFGDTVSEYPRYLDRKILASLALKLSGKCEFRGLNWEQYPEFAPFHRPQIDDEIELSVVYRRSRINLHSNIHGLGLHSRVLEAMASGGFVMTHKSPYPFKAGRMTESFVPGLHFGEYTADDFASQARQWLDDAARRAKAIEESRIVIADRHLWKHRARQILRDLQR